MITNNNKYKIIIKMNKICNKMIATKINNNYQKLILSHKIKF